MWGKEKIKYIQNQSDLYKNVGDALSTVFRLKSSVRAFRFHDADAARKAHDTLPGVQALAQVSEAGRAPRPHLPDDRFFEIQKCGKKPAVAYYGKKDRG